MVKKLFKHEIQAYLRAVLPIHLIVPLLAVAGRILQLFEKDHFAYYIVFGSAVFVFAVGCIGCVVYNTIFAAIRFYKNLFTGQGYLSLTLPVTPAQHILVKLCAAFLFQVISLFIVFFSLSVLTAGDMFVEIIKAGEYIIQSSCKALGIPAILWVFQIIVGFVLTTINQFLLYYACISIGQLARKNRVMSAIGVYFAYYFIIQIIASILMVIFMFVVVEYQTAELLSLLIDRYLPWIQWGTYIISAIMSTVFFLISHIIINKKLNLE